MACICGSKKCDCEEECFCPERLCKCQLCASLRKMCPDCGLPIYGIADYACQLCSCGKKNRKASSRSQTAESDESDDSKVPICGLCKLRIFLVDTGDEEDELKVSYCRCPQNRIANKPVQSEHETSTSTSDHRQVSADRQMRKALSRKTRSQKSNWQAKKVKDQSLNSPEASNNRTETVGAGTLLFNTSDPHLEGQNSSSSSTTTSASNMDINTDYNSPQPLRTEEISMGDLSLLANTSGISIQCTPEASSFQTSEYMQTNILEREKIFPSLPNPIPGPSASGEQQCPSPSVLRNQEMPQAIMPEHAPVESIEKMEKWFGTIQDVLNKRGELPDADEAADLDKDKAEHPEVGDLDDDYDPIPSPLHRGKEDTEQHTDTDRSTSVSQSRIESDHIESESSD